MVHRLTVCSSEPLELLYQFCFPLLHKLVLLPSLITLDCEYLLHGQGLR